MMFSSNRNRKASCFYVNDVRNFLQTLFAYSTINWLVGNSPFILLKYISTETVCFDGFIDNFLSLPELLSSEASLASPGKNEA